MRKVQQAGLVARRRQVQTLKCDVVCAASVRSKQYNGICLRCCVRIELADEGSKDVAIYSTQVSHLVRVQTTPYGQNVRANSQALAVHERSFIGGVSNLRMRNGRCMKSKGVQCGCVELWGGNCGQTSHGEWSPQGTLVGSGGNYVVPTSVYPGSSFAIAPWSLGHCILSGDVANRVRI